MGVFIIKFGVLPLCDQTEVPPEPPVLSVPQVRPVPVLLRTCPLVPDEPLTYNPPVKLISPPTSNLYPGFVLLIPTNAVL